MVSERKLVVPKVKVLFLLFVISSWLVFGIVIRSLVLSDVISPLPPSPRSITVNDQSSSPVLYADRASVSLDAAKSFVNKNLLDSEVGGHVNLYYLVSASSNDFLDSKFTNSEASSYYLLWSAQDWDKKAFDRELSFILDYHLHPEKDFLMWRLDSDNLPVSPDGSNFASDAELRVIKGLLVAEERWGGDDYSDKIEFFANGLRDNALTRINGSAGLFLAPYGGVNDDGLVWNADEVWLSYSDFEVFRALAVRFGSSWRDVYDSMKVAVLDSQSDSGFFDTQISSVGEFHNSLDDGNYSINSLWVMVRASESGDVSLRNAARHSFSNYASALARDGVLYTSYDSDNLPVAGSSESPWVYALVARAAINIQEYSLADSLILKLLEFQELNPSSPYYGSFPEGSVDDLRVSQFTMQESIITLQDYVNN